MLKGQKAACVVKHPELEDTGSNLDPVALTWVKNDDYVLHFPHRITVKVMER